MAFYRNKILNLPSFCLICVLVLIAAVSSFAQGTRGTIRGTVTDQNQAIVPNAKVELVDVAKGTVVRTGVTSEDGVYQFIEVEPSTYNLVITAANFAEYKVSNVKVEPNRNLEVNGALSISASTAEVTVTAGQELIDKESPTLGTNIETRRVEGLPLNGRNILNLASLQPGVFTSGGGLGIRVNGNRSTENNLTLNGANNNEVAVGGAIGVTPRPDAVQEFRLLTSNYEAEFGRNTGSVINLVTRSGTNNIHGNARFFYRPTALSAANFFDNSSAPAALQGTDRRQPFERKELGFNVGGPVFLPRPGEGTPYFYDGRNKTFFFVDYEHRWQKIGGSALVNNLPSEAERNGNFSGLLADGRVLYDPLTATAENPQGNPFPGNIIPLSRISPIARYYIGFMPTADANGQALVSNNTISPADFLTIQLDHNITSNHTLNFTINRTWSQNQNGIAFSGTNIPGFGDSTNQKTTNYVGRYTAILSSNIVNTFMASYSKNDFPSGAPVNTTTPAEIGFTANFVANSQYAGPPHIFFDDRGFSIGNGYQGPQSRASQNVQFQDTVSWIIGNHRLKFGADFVKYQQPQNFLFINQGAIGYSALSGTATNTVGDDFADFLLGSTPDYAQYGSDGRRDFRQTAWAGFIQDNWNVTRNLNLSLGLRYEYNSPLTDSQNRVAYYRAKAISKLLQEGTLTYNGSRIVVAPGGRAPNGLVYVGDPDPVLGGTVPAGGIKKDFNNFAPRFGFAYALNGDGGYWGKLVGSNQTVIRGGFGVAYGAIIGDTALQQLTATGFEGTNAYFDFPGGTLANPFGPDPYPFYSYLGAPKEIEQANNPFLSSDDILVSAPLSQAATPIDPLIRTPYTFQYNLTLERSFANDYVLGVSYVGNQGRKLYVSEAINPAVGTLLPTSLRFQGGTVPAPTTGNSNSRRINADIPTLGAQLTTKGKSQFDSLQVNFQKRLSADGLSYQLAYTFSKSFNDAGENNRANYDILNPKIGWARSNDDRPHRFVASALYELPFFRNTSGFSNRLLNGWSIGAIYTYQSGDLFNVSNPTDTVGTGGGVISYADLGSGNFATQDPREGTGNDRYRAFNANAFAPAVCGTTFNLCINSDGTRGRRGTLGRNQFRLDNPVNNWDAILAKKTRLFGESNYLELRFEAFNLFNTVRFTTIDLNLNSSRFGTHTAAAQGRVVQLGARLTF